ncbi:MAG: arsenosugar biosynthesis radical SAM protein ArsS [Bacteroidetes bacterium]|nr:arsenosugar biosynthesis radical SAM protein ArsS [Bacteroidota bacterium]
MKSLKARKHELSSAGHQLEILDNNGTTFPNFADKLNSLGSFPLKPQSIEILQINLGKMCNQVCEHCHVDAGPDRKEIMTRETMHDCLAAIRNCNTIHTVDLTGGAPEMNPLFTWFANEISKLGKKIIVRSNLTILVSNKKYSLLPELFKEHKITVTASLPCYTADNTDKQRGKGVFQDSIKALKILNEIGYGQPETGLELNLVYNPIGAHLPPSQEKLQTDYKKILLQNYGVVFNNLYTITNIPISRYLEFLLASGKYESYMQTLVDSFNPAAINGLMCKNTVSVSWNGKLYDCDFNQMLELPVNTGISHIKNFNNEVFKQRDIVVKQHCFACTAGAGSSCQGALV